MTNLWILSSEADVVHPGALCSKVLRDVDGEVLNVGKTSNSRHGERTREPLVKDKDSRNANVLQESHHVVSVWELCNIIQVYEKKLAEWWKLKGWWDEVGVFMTFIMSALMLQKNTDKRKKCLLSSFKHFFDQIKFHNKHQSSWLEHNESR